MIFIVQVLPNETAHRVCAHPATQFHADSGWCNRRFSAIGTATSNQVREELVSPSTNCHKSLLFNHKAAAPAQA
jgi:hypothetical protein